MPPIVHSIEIDRPPDEVFSYVTDPSRFAEWQQDVVSVRIEGGPPPSVGSRFTTTRRTGRAERTMTQEITEINPPMSWAARGVAGPIRPNANIIVDPLDDSKRSRVTFALDFKGHGIGLPLVPAVRLMAAKGAPKSYRNLKERLERGD
ncbi:MAG TPA: SRPBCC family protein [Rubrobacter sp.]|nr:SRPBCC family protein [Rubrobacter sp.]